MMHRLALARLVSGLAFITFGAVLALSQTTSYAGKAGSKLEAARRTLAPEFVLQSIKKALIAEQAASAPTLPVARPRSENKNQ